MDLRPRSTTSPSIPSPHPPFSSPVSPHTAPSLPSFQGEPRGDTTVSIASAKAKGTSAGVFFLELFKIILLSLMIIVPVRYFLVQPFFVKGESMVPSFENGEYLLIDEITYRLRVPERGEVIVFRAPRSASTFYLKRIIGLPGETVQIDDGHVTVSNKDFPRGVELDEDYLPSGLRTPGNTKATLGAQEYFVLGDNRGQSSDSRVWGAVPRDHIVGRAWVRGWPLASVGAVHLPQYAFIGN